MKQFHYHFQFIIETVKNLIESDVKNFKFSDIESRKPLQLLKEIKKELPKNDHRWQQIQFKKFNDLYLEKRNEHQPKYVELVMTEFTEIDWNSYGNRVFHQIKEVITILVNCSSSDVQSKLNTTICTILLNPQFLLFRFMNNSMRSMCPRRDTLKI